MLAKIHVNKHVIKSNVKNDAFEPPLTVKTYNETLRCHELTILTEPPVVVRYEPDKPLSCGATVWIETQAEVEGTVYQ